MMGILAFNNIYPTTTLAVFHTKFFFFKNVAIFNFLIFPPQIIKKF
jgi:hypothetical protein